MGGPKENGWGLLCIIEILGFWKFEKIEKSEKVKMGNWRLWIVCHGCGERSQMVSLVDKEVADIVVNVERKAMWCVKCDRMERYFDSAVPDGCLDVE